MTSFRPTTSPPGRLLRLGLVLDTRNPPERLLEIARMCDRAGLDALWLDEEVLSPQGPGGLEPWAAAASVALESRRTRIGVASVHARRSPEILASMVANLDAVSGHRLELTLSGGDAVSVRALLGEATPPLSVAATSPEEVAAAVRVADDVVIPLASASEVGATIALIGAACTDAGRDPATLGVSLQAPISIGRTPAEAQARVEADPLFSRIGHPELSGFFGTLEKCQERVIEVAHAGVTDLRCVIPNTPDVADVIAQLTAIAVGSVDLFRPGAPRSPSPEPPQGWGGRSPRPHPA